MKLLKDQNIPNCSLVHIHSTVPLVYCHIPVHLTSYNLKLYCNGEITLFILELKQLFVCFGISLLMCIPGSSWLGSTDGRLRGRVKLTVGAVLSSFKSAKFGDDVQDEAAWLNLVNCKDSFVFEYLFFYIKSIQ